MLRQVGKRAVPRRYHYLFHTRARRHAVATLWLHADVRLDVYWKVLGDEAGPALSVYAWGKELLRFDCYGPGKGHRHIIYGHEKSGHHFMLPLRQASREAQIDAVVEELCQDLEPYLRGSPVRRDRPIHLPPGPLARTLGEARLLMLGYVRRFAIRVS